MVGAVSQQSLSTSDSTCFFQGFREAPKPRFRCPTKGQKPFGVGKSVGDFWSLFGHFGWKTGKQPCYVFYVLAGIFTYIYYSQVHGCQSCPRFSAICCLRDGLGKLHNMNCNCTGMIKRLQQPHSTSCTYVILYHPMSIYILQYDRICIYSMATFVCQGWCEVHLNRSTHTFQQKMHRWVGPSVWIPKHVRPPYWTRPCWEILIWC